MNNTNKKIQNLTNNNKKIIKTTPKSKKQDTITITNSSNHISNKIKKIDTKSKNIKKLSRSSVFNTNSNTISSASVPYQNILDGLMKFLENKINLKSIIIV